MAYWLILGYFLVLFAERTRSLVLSWADHRSGVFGDGFTVYVFLAAIMSLSAFLVLLMTINRDFVKALFVKGTQVNPMTLAVSIGVILVSGMVHTEHTLAPMQFVAYGMLIVALVIVTVSEVKNSGNGVMRWMSLAYLIAFSMAIPVVYRSEMATATIFHVVEAVVSIVMVAVFAWMTYRVLSGSGVNLFSIASLVIAAVGDTLVLGLRWKEQVNTFVLIFAVVTIVIWIAGRVVVYQNAG